MLYFWKSGQWTVTGQWTVNEHALMGAQTRVAVIAISSLLCTLYIVSCYTDQWQVSNKVHCHYIIWHIGRHWSNLHNTELHTISYECKLTLPNIDRFTNFRSPSTGTLRRKLTIMWLLKIPPHFKCVGILPCVWNINVIKLVLCGRRWALQRLMLWQQHVMIICSTQLDSGYRRISNWCSQTDSIIWTSFVDEGVLLQRSVLQQVRIVDQSVNISVRLPWTAFCHWTKWI